MRLRLLAMFLLAPLAALGAGPDSTVTPPEGRWVAGSYAADGGNRRYQLWVPGSYDPSKRQMLVVLLHGCTQDAADLARGTRVAAHAERAGFLALLPEQPAGANPQKCWNWFDSAHQQRGAGEPAIVAGMTEQVMREYSVDPARVHLAGISAGGAMATLVAVAYPERWASVAVHSGIPWRGATSVMAALGVMSKGVADADALGVAAFEAMGDRARAIPALVIHGDKDPVVNPWNGRQVAQQWVATNARAIGVPGRSAVETTGATAGLKWTRICHFFPNGACMVEEVIVHELGHAWSGGSREGTFADDRGLDAMGEMVRFFSEHPRRGGR